MGVINRSGGPVYNFLLGHKLSLYTECLFHVAFGMRQQHQEGVAQSDFQPIAETLKESG